VITIVTFKWKSDFREYTSEHVNALYCMLKKHTTVPFRFICVTDDPTGVKYGEILPLWGTWSDIELGDGLYLNCYRRLEIFSHLATKLFGSKVLMIDLDVVIFRNIDHLLTREEEFIAWNKGSTVRYQGGLILHKTGTRTQLWRDFKGQESREEAKEFPGTDQAWISYRLGEGETTWGKEEGIYSYSLDIKRRRKPPRNCCVIMFHGKYKPWNVRHSWLRRAWLGPLRAYEKEKE